MSVSISIGRALQRGSTSSLLKVIANCRASLRLGARGPTLLGGGDYGRAQRGDQTKFLAVLSNVPVI